MLTSIPIISILGVLLCFGPTTSLTAQSHKQDSCETKAEGAIACKLRAFNTKQQASYQRLVNYLRKNRKQIEELPNGYAIAFSSQPNTCLQVTKFVTMERRCCPFISFTMRFEPNNGLLWLQLTGPEGTKEILQESLISEG